MAEIYTYSANANQGHMSPDTSNHINSVLSDLGLGGTSADSADVSRTSAEPVTSEASAPSPTASHAEAATPPGQVDGAGIEPDHTASILAGGSDTAVPQDPAAPARGPVADGAPAFHAPPVETQVATAYAPPPGADSVPGGHAGTGAETFGGLGTDTLWGSDGGTHGLSTLPPAPAGSDTIRSSGGMETIYGGNATIYASGHSATLHTDTVHAGSEGATMDGSASAQAVHTDGSSAFADLPGGSGSDTIVLHDGAGTMPPAGGDDAHTAGAYGTHDPYSSHDPYAAHDAGVYAYGSPDSVVGGDGSDPFALLGYSGGSDGYDSGHTDTGTAHHDPYLADGHVTHSDTGTTVSYHDGYDPGYSGADQLEFKDTVMAG
ncbi:hypothetical protein [Aureimonas phyllosphaerae]|uniref:Uncharacterized protein n=1 Tax=Aureimonas phyllosphaerae TaxID=1166078 RepID=A0A7W6BTW6_9HYPH|nr:hypothetical protein [Aureimonas phyllosphaerae]MBB3936230.1 hypothetical protein [Aureimonas phyllosphaerae]MBB3960045.1 hypothetical protein [Aureimonas phyllosphaerae]SFF32661.1 hypothetical protein SAMN05216566_10827 [Aureimonas phyllosphaerae]